MRYKYNPATFLFTRFANGNDKILARKTNLASRSFPKCQGVPAPKRYQAFFSNKGNHKVSS